MRKIIGAILILLIAGSARAEWDEFRLDRLKDVAIDQATLADGDVPVYNATLKVWENGAGGSGSPLTIKEIDGTPTGTPDTLKVTNGTLTDNGDGSFTLAVGGGLALDGSNTADTVGTTPWEFFKNELIPDAQGGRYLKVYRHATEGDSDVRIGTTDDGTAFITSDSVGGFAGNLWLIGDTGTKNISAWCQDFSIGMSWDTTISPNTTLTQYGLITATGTCKKAQWKVNDTVDAYTLDMESPLTGLNLHQNTTIADAADGQDLRVYRKATSEGTDYVRTYIDQYQQCTMYATNELFIWGGAGTPKSGFGITSYYGLELARNADMDINCFKAADVADAADGRVLTVNRMAAEGDNYFYLYVDKDRQARIYSDAPIAFTEPVGTVKLDRLRAGSDLYLYGNFK